MNAVMGKDIFYKTPEEIEYIRASCLLVCETLGTVAGHIKPGVRMDKLDMIAEEFIRDHQAAPGFKGYRDFPATLCMSVNEEVVHGIPTGKEIRDGDIVSIDCGVFMNGFYGDAAYTFAVGEVSEDVMDLLVVTNKSLYLAIDQAVAGNRLGDIGYAVQQYCEHQHQYGVVRELVGHGIGRMLHESPEVPNYGRRGRGTQLREGLVIAIEPMVNLGTRKVRTLKDGWTVISRDKKPSAHYEHTIAIKKGEADVLSNHSFIEQNVEKNPNLKSIGSRLAKV